jgi:zinc protease
MSLSPFPQAFLWAALAVSTTAAGCIAQQQTRAVTERRSSVRPERNSSSPRLSGPRLVSQVLPSGLLVLLDEDPHATAVGLVSVIHGGSASDPEGAEGLAHLVEHLTFRAVDPATMQGEGQGPSGARPLTRWDRLIKYAAAETNGHTTPDCLIFYEFGPVASLQRLLALEAARLADPLVGVDENAFALERQIIGSEHLLRDDPRGGGWAASVLFPLLFSGQHPYGRSLGGTEESRRKLTLAQARAYAAQAFRPERMTLLVTAPPGAISIAAITDALPPNLRGEPGRLVARPRPPTAPPAAAADAAPPVPAAEAVAPRVEVKPSPLPTRELWIGWTLPGGVGESGAEVSVLRYWLNQDLSASQLSQEERHIRHVGVALQQGASASALFVRVLVAEGADRERVAQVVTARVASLWAREPNAAEAFADLQSVLETERLLREPHQLPRALQVAWSAALNGRARSMAEMQAAMAAVPSSAVAKLAYQRLTRARARAMIFTPTATAAVAPASLPAASEPGRSPAARRTSPAAAGPPPELVAGAASWDPRDLPELPGPMTEVTARKLPTGLTVITVRRPSAATVAWLGFRGGYADADPPLLVELAMRARPDARQAAKLRILPGRATSRDMSFEAVSFLPANLTDALMLLFAKATTLVAEWPPRDTLERMLAPLAADEDALSAKASGAFWRALLGDHPYARTVSTADLDKLSLSDVDSWVARVHTVRNAALVVVGDVRASEVERAAEILSRKLSTPTWVADPPAPPPPSLRPANTERMVPVLAKRPGSLTEIRVGCLLPPLAAADRGHYELLKQAIEARLNAALRVDHGDGYGVSVAFERLRGGTTYLVTSTSVPDHSLARALGAVRSQWQRWAQSGFDPGELAVARARYAGSLALAHGSGHALASQLLTDWNADPAALVELGRPPNIAALRPARVNQLFETCKANGVLALTGNEPLLRRTLDQVWPGLPPPGR